MRLLIIEDDISVRNVLRLGLESESYTVDEAENGEQGSYLARVNQYDLIILDNVLPKKLGKEVISEIRQAGLNTPVILLSAKSDINSKVELLNLGADDYLTKPFSFEELKARISSILRRPSKIEDVVLKIGKIYLNVDTHEVRNGQKKLYLTRKEFQMLELLMKNSGRVLSRSIIMEKVWDINADPFSNTLEAHIRNLRKKLGDTQKRLIRNIPGRGYKLISPSMSI